MYIFMHVFIFLAHVLFILIIYYVVLFCMFTNVTQMLYYMRASLVAQLAKNLSASAGDARDGGSIPGTERSPCLENSKDREVWWAAVPGVTESQTRLSTHISPWKLLL